MRLSILILAVSATAQTWTMQTTGTTASLRGLSAANQRVVWASGTKGTCLRTVDGGITWTSLVVPGAVDLDFRDVEAVSDQVAYLLSSGPGEKSRIYKTVDGGAHWDLQHTNPDPKGFLDGFAFWDARRGIVVGDPVGGRFVILTTADGGAHWIRQVGPEAVEGEGAFAASGTSIALRGKHEAWFASGGEGGARVFHSTDDGKRWTAVTTPIRNDGATAGIFSISVRKDGRGLAVGGDYAKPAEATGNIAVSSDAGRHWTGSNGSSAGHPGGFRSAAVFTGDLWVVTGTSGSDLSRDGGQTWVPIPGGFNSLAAARGYVWAAGSAGRIARLDLSNPRGSARPE